MKNLWSKIVGKKWKDELKYLVAPIVATALLFEGLYYVGSKAELLTSEDNVSAAGEALNGIRYIENTGQNILGFSTKLACKQHLSKFRKEGGNMIAAEDFAHRYPDSRIDGCPGDLF